MKSENSQFYYEPNHYGHNKNTSSNSNGGTSVILYPGGCFSPQEPVKAVDDEEEICGDDVASSASSEQVDQPLLRLIDQQSVDFSSVSNNNKTDGDDINSVSTLSQLAAAPVAALEDWDDDTSSAATITQQEQTSLSSSAYQQQLQEQAQQISPRSRSRYSIPAGMRSVYGEAGSQPNVTGQGDRNRQQSLNDLLAGDKFYDAPPAPNQLPLKDYDQQNRREADDAATLMKNLSMFLQASGAGAVPPIGPSTGITSGGTMPSKPGGAKPLSVADNERTKRTSKTYVEVRVVFLKIGEIDTLKEQYSADVYIQSRWRETTLDQKSPEELKTTDLTKLWSPCLYIENALSEGKDSSMQSATVNERGEAFVAERRKLRGVFLENLELQNFPLDVQDLSITVVSERPDCDVELVPDEEDPSSVNIGTFADEQEWQLYEHVEVTKKTVKIEFANQQRQHSAVQVTCRAARRPGYFYYNVFLVMFFISSMAFGTFSVDATLPQNRLQLSFTLLLTSITFKMVINQSLPRISYLTYMDKYVLMSLVFLVLVCIWHSIVPTICADKSLGSFYDNKIENYVILGFGILYVIGHLLFAGFVYIYAWKRRLHMAQKDREFRVRSDFYGASSSARANKPLPISSNNAKSQRWSSTSAGSALSAGGATVPTGSPSAPPSSSSYLITANTGDNNTKQSQQQSSPFYYNNNNNRSPNVNSTNGR